MNQSSLAWMAKDSARIKRFSGLKSFQNEATQCTLWLVDVGFGAHKVLEAPLARTEPGRG